jgi:hypothetical protein
MNHGQDVEELALVLMDALDLHVKEGSRAEVQSTIRQPQDVLAKPLLVALVRLKNVLQRGHR